jgi:serine/threonine-protein kinase RsbW
MGGSEEDMMRGSMAEYPTTSAPAPLSLVIPGRPEYVALCRLVAGAVGARDSLDEEFTADLKVLVTEACNCLLARDGSADPSASGGLVATGHPIRMDIDSRSDAVVISVFSPEHRSLIAWLESSPPTSEVGLGLTIMRALSDEMDERDAQPAGTVLSLTKRLPA